MKVEAAFIFIAPNANPNLHKCDIATEIINLHVVGVANYTEAVTAAGELADKGVKAIELCGGFGNEGIAAITKAVKGKAKVGAVKFDCHPGLEFKSGDDVFA